MNDIVHVFGLSNFCFHLGYFLPRPILNACSYFLQFIFSMKIILISLFLTVFALGVV